MKLLTVLLLACASHALVVKPRNNENMSIHEPLESSFQHIAMSNQWGSKESISGAGSEMESTSPARSCLGKWIKKYNIGFFMDMACGDANWQGSIPGIDSIKYQGYDIAKLAVEAAQSKNSQHKGMTFGHFDLVTGVPPGKPDLLMIRDTIQHLPLKLGHDMLVNAKRSGARWLVVSSFNEKIERNNPDIEKNKDIKAGGFYENDVHEKPFSMPAAEEECDNYSLKYSLEHSMTHDRVRLELIDLHKWADPDAWYAKWGSEWGSQPWVPYCSSSPPPCRWR